MVTIKGLKILKNEVIEDRMFVIDTWGVCKSVIESPLKSRIVKALNHAIKLTKLYDAMCTGEITKRRK